MRTLILTLTLFLSFPSVLLAGEEVENVLLGEKQVLTINAAFNVPVTVKFPYPVSYVIPADSRIDVQAGNDFVILKIISSSLKEGVVSVVLNKDGKPFVVPVQIKVVNTSFPLKVVVKDRERIAEQMLKQAKTLVGTSLKQAQSTPVTELVSAMIRNTEFPDSFKPVKGYTIVDHKGKELKAFSSNNLLQAKLLYEYRSPARIGAVIELVNRSIYPLTISEEDFAADGVLAVSLSRRRLAPRPYSATEKLTGDYRAYLYIVIGSGRWLR